MPISVLDTLSLTEESKVKVPFSITILGFLEVSKTPALLSRVNHLGFLYRLLNELKSQ